MNTSTQISLQDITFNSFGSIPQSGIAGSYDNYISIFFEEEKQTVLHSSCTILQFCISTNSSQEFQFLRVLTNTCFLFVFDSSHTKGCCRYVIVLIFVPLMISDVAHFFKCLSVIYISSLEKFLLKSFAHFFFLFSFFYFYFFLII